METGPWKPDHGGPTTDGRAVASGLGEAIRQILLHVWDPIGVRGVPQAQDEYDDYVGPLLGAVVDGLGVDEVRVLLDRLAVRIWALRPARAIPGARPSCWSA